MNPTRQSSTTSIHPARQLRILRLPKVKAKTGFGRRTIYAFMAKVKPVQAANRFGLEK
jgi:prophage regulatory protein